MKMMPFQRSLIIDAKTGEEVINLNNAALSNNQWKNLNLKYEDRDAEGEPFESEDTMQKDKDLRDKIAEGEADAMPLRCLGVFSKDLHDEDSQSESGSDDESDYDSEEESGMEDSEEDYNSEKDSDMSSDKDKSDGSKDSDHESGEDEKSEKSKKSKASKDSDYEGGEDDKPALKIELVLLFATVLEQKQKGPAPAEGSLPPFIWGFKEVKVNLKELIEENSDDKVA